MLRVQLIDLLSMCLTPIIRFNDLGDYAEPFSVAKLLGLIHSAG